MNKLQYLIKLHSIILFYKKIHFSQLQLHETTQVSLVCFWYKNILNLEFVLSILFQKTGSLSSFFVLAEVIKRERLEKEWNFWQWNLNMFFLNSKGPCLRLHGSCNVIRKTNLQMECGKLTLQYVLRQ